MSPRIERENAVDDALFTEIALCKAIVEKTLAGVAGANTTLAESKQVLDLANRIIEKANSAATLAFDQPTPATH